MTTPEMRKCKSCGRYNDPIQISEFTINGEYQEKDMMRTELVVIRARQHILYEQIREDKDEIVKLKDELMRSTAMCRDAEDKYRQAACVLAGMQSIQGKARRKSLWSFFFDGPVHGVSPQ